MIAGLVIGIAAAYSTYGAPSEFGNETMTTCYVGGDYGIVDCIGNLTIGSIYPQSTLTYDIGSGSLRWRNLYVTNLSADFGEFAEDVSVLGDITATGNVTADYYFGDGSLLTGIQQGTLNFFFHNETSDVSGSKILSFEPNDTGEVALTATITANNQIIQNFTTESGIPGLTFIPEGLCHYHIHGEKTAGTKEVRIYYKKYILDSAGGYTLLDTSGFSNFLTGSEAVLNVWDVHDEEILNSSDRFHISIIAEVSGAGTNPQIELNIEGNTASRLSLPGPVASTANFIPYTGAVKNVDLGSHNLTIDDTLRLTNTTTTWNIYVNINGTLVFEEE